MSGPGQPEGWRPGWEKAATFSRHLYAARDAFERGDLATVGRELVAAAAFAHATVAEAAAHETAPMGGDAGAPVPVGETLEADAAGGARRPGGEVVLLADRLQTARPSAAERKSNKTRDLPDVSGPGT